MLDQRRAQEKGYITLKEAAAIANYSPDYVGQLIRAGKIRGEQVYSNVAWVTTEDEVLAYLKDKNRSVDAEVVTPFLAQPYLKYILYLLIIVSGAFLLLMQYILYVSIDDSLDRSFLSESQERALESTS